MADSGDGGDEVEDAVIQIESDLSLGDGADAAAFEQFLTGGVTVIKHTRRRGGGARGVRRVRRVLWLATVDTEQGEDEDERAGEIGGEAERERWRGGSEDDAATAVGAGEAVTGVEEDLDPVGHVQGLLMALRPRRRGCSGEAGEVVAQPRAVSHAAVALQGRRRLCLGKQKGAVTPGGRLGTGVWVEDIRAVVEGRATAAMAVTAMAEGAAVARGQVAGRVAGMCLEGDAEVVGDVGVAGEGRACVGRCFSLIGERYPADRTSLDLEARSEGEREALVAGLRGLLLREAEGRRGRGGGRDDAGLVPMMPE